jgi:hypothetical protein
MKGRTQHQEEEETRQAFIFHNPSTTLSSGVIISSSFYCYFGCPGERDPNVLSKSSSPHFHVLSVYVVFLSPFDIPRLLRIWHPRNQQERNNSSSSWTEKNNLRRPSRLVHENPPADEIEKRREADRSTIAINLQKKNQNPIYRNYFQFFSYVMHMCLIGCNS